MIKNSEEAALKRRRTSLKGKIERRYTAILFAEHDIRKYRHELHMVEETLKEYKK